MAESLVQVTEGSGKKLHTFAHVVGGNTIEDEFVVFAEQPIPSYVIDTPAVSVATANDHVLQIMAGASLNVWVRRIRVYQSALATTAAIGTFQIFRLTTAGTGGTTAAVDSLDATDSAAGATAMTLPTVKGTETTRLYGITAGFIQTVPTAGVNPLLVDFDFAALRGKSIRIAAGTANGIALKISTAIAAATVIVVADIAELTF
jgi:hypothetical protein